MTGPSTGPAASSDLCSWNKGKSGAQLDLTSSTTPGLQILKGDHTRTVNPCDWLLCRCAALLLVGCPHSFVYLHLPVVEGLIFCISAAPHLGTSFPLFHACANVSNISPLSLEDVEDGGVGNIQTQCWSRNRETARHCLG